MKKTITILFIAATMFTASHAVAVSCGPDSVGGNDAYWRGTQLYNMGRLSEAFECLRQALRDKKYSKEANAYMVQIRKEIAANARRCNEQRTPLVRELGLFDRPLRQIPVRSEESTWAQIRNAKRFEAKHDYISAILIYNELLSNHPADMEILLRMVRCHESMLAFELNQATKQARDSSPTPSNYLPELLQNLDIDWLV